MRPAEASEVAIAPDRVTMFLHDINLYLVAVVLFAISIVAAFYSFTVSLPIFVLAALCCALKPLLCGWVHSFTAYAMLSPDHEVEFVEKK